MCNDMTAWQYWNCFCQEISGTGRRSQRLRKAEKLHFAQSCYYLTSDAFFIRWITEVFLAVWPYFSGDISLSEINETHTQRQVDDEAIRSCQNSWTEPQNKVIRFKSNRPHWFELRNLAVTHWIHLFVCSKWAIARFTFSWHKSTINTYINKNAWNIINTKHVQSENIFL